MITLTSTGDTSTRHNHLINKAFDVAKLSLHHRWRHGCVIARRNRILVATTNKLRNPPKISYQASTVHAEVAAIALLRYSDIKPSGLTIYVARINSSERPALSKPCDDCQDALDDFGIREIVYTNDEYSYKWLKN